MGFVEMRYGFFHSGGSFHQVVKVVLGVKGGEAMGVFMERSKLGVSRCAEFLHKCLGFGWGKGDLDWLEEMWWRYRDKDGNFLRDEKGMIIHGL